MRCSMGTCQAKLTVLPLRTVFLTGQPMANISDHLTMVNLAPFGRCRSLGFPATASATAAAHGKLTPMPCMHNTPFPWMGGKNDYIVKGNPALLKSSTCSCIWGGTISITDDGQRDICTVDLNKKTKEDFKKEGSDIKGIDAESVLDGIQLALDAAGFVPGLGAIPDLTNAAISAIRGNWAEAGLSVLAAVPVVGDAAAGAKLAKRGVKAAKALNKGEKTVKATGTLTKEGKRAIAKKYISKDISKDGLLKEKGVTPENVDEVFRQVKIERKREAISFYKENMKAEKESKTLITKYSDEAFENAKKEMKTQKEIEATSQKIKENRKTIVNEINGIDFSKPIERVNIKNGDVFYQYSHGDLLDNNVHIGSFATNDATFTPSQLGISAVGKNGVKNQYELTVRNVGEKGIPALKSTSKEIKDTWSLKLFRPNDINTRPSISVPVQTSGGGTQFKIPGMNKNMVDIRQINIIR